MKIKFNTVMAAVFFFVIGAMMTDVILRKQRDDVAYEMEVWKSAAKETAESLEECVVRYTSKANELLDCRTGGLTEEP